MKCEYYDLTFPSSDGKSTVFAEVYLPKDNKSPRGIIQLSHGMIDYVTRYGELAEFLCGRGFIFAGNHHLGHGKTASCDEDFGYFAERDGIEYLIGDLHKMNGYLKKTYPGIPVYMLGHSMGSFLARIYAERYPESISGVALQGTAGPHLFTWLGKLLVRAKMKTRGDRYRSKTVDRLAFRHYNMRFPKHEGRNAWITRNVKLLDKKCEDKYSSFIFTLSGYHDLFHMLDMCNCREHYKSYPKNMPTYIASGGMDPVGEFGRGPGYVFRRLKKEGCREVEIKIYEGARHELFNETNREEVFCDLAKWLDERTV